MHEMSIVMSILDMAADRARAADARVINAIEIEVGGLAGVELEPLRFCFQVARRDIAPEAELIVHEIPGRGRCAGCGSEAAMDFAWAVCPDCGEVGLEVLQGRELRVRSLSVD
ncbi:MAG: hydrogenase maturation nickel metallochaperone HypA [bacterium]|nr:hydrogenase maturation nickel metallochaperone HypA [bacterium]